MRTRKLTNPQRVTITFEGDMYGRLVEISTQTGVPVAELIRRQMMSFVQSQPKKK